MNIQEILTQRQKLLKKIHQLEKIAFFDQLTGLPNRHALAADLVKLPHGRTKRRGRFLGVLLLDIDWFKPINDKFGHLTGDKVLKKAAKIIDDSTRKTLFRSGDKVYRFGGEEFVVILLGVSLKGIWVIAERIRKNIAKNLVKEFPDIKKVRSRITISVGGKTYDLMELQKQALTVDQLQQHLVAEPDDYLYKAKNLGRNRIVINGKSSRLPS